MHMNLVVLLIAAVVPMLVGFIWYNPKVFGNAWMQASGLTEDKIKDANMALIFGVTFVFSFLLATSLQMMVIHQFHIGSLFMGQPFEDASTEVGAFYKTIMDKVGGNFRTFKHGALHGTLGGFFLALPLIGTNALFERKGFKYIAINSGYWIISMGLMGGVICAFT